MNTNKKKIFWDSKPYWCQPWSIIGFGIVSIFSIWKVFNNLIITSIVSLIIFSWWAVFLILAPNSYKLDNEND